MTRIQTLRFVCAMKRDVVRSVVIFLLLSLVFALVSCEEKIPDLSKKERDPRLVGGWYAVEKEGETTHPKDRFVEFLADGSCRGFTFAGGGRQFYYTEGRDRLMFFVQGDWLKITNRVYDRYYEIKSDTLFLWSEQKQYGSSEVQVGSCLCARREIVGLFVCRRRGASEHLAHSFSKDQPGGWSSCAGFY